MAAAAHHGSGVLCEGGTALSSSKHLFLSPTALPLLLLLLLLLLMCQVLPWAGCL
jgi:hypothetical protein